MASSVSGDVLGPSVRALASDLAARYVAGDLVIVAGAGVSRASGLPGWEEIIESLQTSVASATPDVSAAELEAVLSSVHRSDPISRADSIQRLVGTSKFRSHLHAALYPRARIAPYRPSVAHWHIASMVDHHLMPDVFTSNYDDLLEVAKKSLGRTGRVRHFHGRLPQGWNGTALADPPVVTARDYMAAEDDRRYDRLAAALEKKTVLLAGFSLSDPNLTRVIRNRAQDCRAILVASPGALSATQQKLRVDLLRRYWRGLNVSVTAIEAHEELPAFFLAMRREILALQGRTLSAVSSVALRVSVTRSLASWVGLREWRDRLEDAVEAAKQLAPSAKGDSSLRAGFYAIEPDGYLRHAVSSATRRSDANRPRRRLLADHRRPWGAAGYAYSAGVPIVSSSSGAAYDRNVPIDELLRWQDERAAQKRLPAASVLCVPAWVQYDRRFHPVGVLYFSSRRGAAFDDPGDDEELRSLLQLTFEGMIKPERAIGGRTA